MSGDEKAATGATASSGEKSSRTSKTPAQSILASGLRAMRRGRPDLAERAFERAIRAGDPSVTAQAVWQLGKLAYEQGELDRAHEYFQRAVESHDHDMMPHGYNSLGVVSAARQEVTEAQLNYFRAIETSHPEAAPKAAWNSGLLFLDAGDLHAAEAALALAAESGHTEMAPRAAVQLGLVRAQLGDTRGAVSALTDALSAQDSKVAADAALNLGLVHLAQGDAEGAQQAWGLALRSPNPQQAEKVRDYLALIDEVQSETRPSTGTKAPRISEAESPPVTAHTEATGLVAPRQRSTFLTALDEAIALSEDDPDSIAAILQQFRDGEVFGLGNPAGEVSPDGHGTEIDLLHFTIDDGAIESRVVLPVFTQPSIMRRALIRNPDWQSLSVLKLNGGALYDNANNDVAVIINPGSRLEFELPQRSTQVGDT